MRWWEGRPWLQAIMIAAASRAFAVVILVGAWYLKIPSSPFPPFAGPFVIWDGEWYAYIATYGYHADAVIRTAYGPGYHDFAFFPAWPMLLRALTSVTGLSMETVAPAAANLLFIAAAVPIHAVLARVAGPSIGRWGFALFAFSPGAYVGSLAYSEPLFLLLVGLFFVAVARRSAAGATLATVGAQLVRLTGGAVAIASLPDLADPDHRRRAVLVILASGLTFAAWWAWIAMLTGNPTGYLLGTPSWFLNQGPNPIPTGLASLNYADQLYSVIAIVFIAFLVVGTRWLAHRAEWRLALFSLACLLTTLLDTQTTMPRLAGVAFPAFVGLAAVLPSNRWRWATLLLFAGAEAVMAASAVRRLITP